MMATTSTRIELQVLTANELEGYIPDERFWRLRQMWRGDDSNMLANAATGAIRMIVVRIAFHNDSDDPVEFPFDNTACKAELQNLVIHDDTGIQVQPVHNLLIRPKAESRASHRIAGHAEFVLDIVGEITEDWLVFPGAKYPIPRNRILDIRFRHGGNSSSAVRIHV